MSTNPVMEKNPYFRPGAATPNYGQPYSTAGTATAVPASPDRLASDPYAMPAPHAMPTGPVAAYGTTMRYNDALEKTGILLGITVLSAIAAAVALPLQFLMPLAIGGSIAALVISIVAATKPLVKPGLAIAYAVLEGATLGAITGAFNMVYPGIAFQAILATVVIVAVAVGLHMSGKVRTSARGRRIILTIMIGAIVYGLADMALVLTGVLGNSMDYFTLGGIPIGIIMGIVLIIAAGYSLIGDLELIQYAETNGAPREFAWTCAFGLIISIIWIYVEVLRILAILASDR